MVISGNLRMRFFLMTEALKQCFFKTSTTVVPHIFPDDPSPQAPYPHSLIMITEIADALCPTSNKSVPRPSGYNYKLVKWAFNTNPTCLQNLFNTCLQLGHHLKKWKVATIIVILKPGKEDYSLPKCYCLVALLKCLGKLLEKIVATHLTHDITSLCLIPTTQFSAHPYSSTINASLCLTHDIKTAHTLREVCGSLLFNIQGFFNNMNHGRLTALIESLGFAPEICRWAKSFLKDRSICLQFNGYSSDEIELEMGMPQGSPISPILSIIYASPLLHLMKC
jgi:hypothetical protein